MIHQRCPYCLSSRDGIKHMFLCGTSFDSTALQYKRSSICVGDAPPVIHSTPPTIFDTLDSQNAYKAKVDEYAANINRLKEQIQLMKEQLSLAERAINNLRLRQPLYTDTLDPKLMRIEGELPAQEAIRKP